ncbi:MAG: calcium-binding protein [Pseudomonadota bacterium]
MTISGTNGSDVLNGTPGDDIILGLDGFDSLFGFSGNDSLFGGTSFDRLNGGLGDDVLTGGGFGDWFEFAAEAVTDPGTGQTVLHGFGHDTVTDFGSGDQLDMNFGAIPGGLTYDGYQIVGSDTILRFGVGTAQDSSITLLNYHVMPGEFNPAPTGGFLFGNIQGEISHDDLIGTAGGDNFEGWAGNDTLTGNDGDDRLYGGTGNDTLYGGADRDELHGEDGDDTLDAGTGDDEIWDGSGNDTINAGSGNDEIHVASGNDLITTGTGNDSINFRMEVVTDPANGEQVLLGIGHNTITDFGVGDYLEVDAGQFSGPTPPVEAFEIVGDNTILRFATRTAQESSITILNYHVHEDDISGVNSHFLDVDGTIQGLLTPEHIVGSDTEYDDLHGYGGNDTLEGLALRDDLYGGTGDDILFGGDDRDWLYSGAGNDTANGDAGNDVIWGEFGDNYLNGGTGNDELLSGTGNDTMAGGPGEDVFDLRIREILNAEGDFDIHGFGHDVIADFSDGDVIYINTQSWNGTGDAFSSHEFVGADTLLRFAVGTAQESSVTIQNYHLPLSEIDTWDDFHAFDYDPAFLASPLNLVSGTAGHDNMLGTTVDDHMIGGDGSDNLQGAQGNDILEPGTGGPWVQNLYGHLGDDIYLIDADSGRVRISTWAEKAGWGADTVKFRDLNLQDVSVTTYDAGDADGARLVIAWYKDGDFGEVTMAHMGDFIEVIEFADGQSFTPDALTPGHVVQTGTTANDHLSGTVYDDHLIGNDGTDHLQAAGGDDILDPGKGCTGIQYLYGQTGNDTYVIGQDVGLARINIWAEGAATGTADRVQFTDLNSADLIVSQHVGTGADGTEMRLSWDQAGITGELQIAQLGTHIESFEFADGEVLTAAEVMLL